MGLEFFERMLDPRRLLKLSERSPEAALAYIQVLRELGGGRSLERFAEREMGSGFFESNLNLAYLNNVFERKPSAMATWLTFARMANSRRMIDSLSQVISEFFRRRSGSSIGLGLLPISALSNLHWLARESGNADLAAALSVLADEGENENRLSSNPWRARSR